jgi:hypothetical protein
MVNGMWVVMNVWVVVRMWTKSYKVHGVGSGLNSVGSDRTPACRVAAIVVTKTIKKLRSATHFSDIDSRQENNKQIQGEVSIDG